MRDRAAAAFLRYGDFALASSITGLALVQIVGVDESTLARAVSAASFVALGVAAAVRVRFPLLLVSFLVAFMPLGALLPKRLGDVEAIGLFVVLAIYSAAAHTDGRRTIVAAVLTIALAIGALAGDPEGVNIAGLVFFGLLAGGPWVAGRIVHRRRSNEARLEREKAEAEAAITEERARIARELHDVVAHAISVIVLQARGGRKVLEADPEEARQAFDAIDRTASAALAEMRRLLGLLRESDEGLALAPPPTLSRLDELVAQVREAGLPVEVAIEGERAALPPGVDLSAYRIVQEALTNALKHAGPATARVVVRYGADQLDVEVADDGAGSANGDGGGHGLRGIAERVAVFGGEVEAGERPGGGYAVRARLPFASER